MSKSATNPGSSLPTPTVSRLSNRELSLESTLADLPLHTFQVDVHHPGQAIASVFERFPTLPGVVLQERGQFLGMVSRSQFLEFLLRPQGVELFLSHPLSVLYSYARTPGLVLPASTPILVAAQLALRRSLPQQSEPIVVMQAPEAQLPLPSDTARSFRPKTERSPLPTYCLLDIHDLNIAYWQIRGIETQVRYERTHAQMIQTEKMASLGRLVDGVAHEILDPVGFIWGNLVHISTYTEQILQLLAGYEQHVSSLPPLLRDLCAEIELDYIRHDLPQSIRSVQAGADRLKRLATSLQNFCHIDDVYPKPANLHDCLDSILFLLKSRVSGEINIVRNYGHLPPVTCFAGQLNQVFMNILTNAIDALLNQAARHEFANTFREASLPTQCSVPKPQITVTTEVRSFVGEVEPAHRWVVIRIRDNGPGLDPEQYQRILESFTVEKRAAKETSLAVSYQIVTAKHGGKLRLRSPIDDPEYHRSSFAESSRDQFPLGGTEFEIILPLL